MAVESKSIRSCNHCMTGLFLQKSLRVGLGPLTVSQIRTLVNWPEIFFHRPDALVAQPTVSKAQH